ncbi:MAG TPA: ABC transporter ATP-binding protein, partial [Trueperaceae bacterium]|nr:ABC transporter ATP-binding protein [Trueperaceae bacterium]
LRAFYRRVALVPQDPLPSLNPARRVGRQIEEVVDPTGSSGPATRARALEMLHAVGMADPERVAGAHPHQLSGGMQQRVLIAMALAGEPDLLVLDEPTTNLDVTTEVTILDLVRDLVRDRDTAVLYVSHSLGVVAELCDRVAVLYAGELVEDAPTRDLYLRPRHPYTQGLFDSVPRLGTTRRSVALRPIPGRIPSPHDLPPGCVFEPRCPIAVRECSQGRPALEAAGDGWARCIRWRDIVDGRVDAHQPAPPARVSHPAGDVPVALDVKALRKHFALRRSLLDVLRGGPQRSVRAVEDISLTVRQGRTLGLVGESGSGKSTTARAIVGLDPASAGDIVLAGEPVAAALGRRPPEAIRRLQMVFQSSDEALNPYRTVGAALRRPFRRLGGLGRSEAEARVARLLEDVQLTAAYAARRPAELSGGEKQRVAIARAFAAEPEVLVFDESVSGLDVSVQAAILNLIGDLQEERGTGYLFISHDLAVVSFLSDYVTVVYLGNVMEAGPAERVLTPPYHPYTEALLSAIPLLDPGAERAHIRLEGEVPSPVDVPGGCPFHTRCPRFLGDVCVEQAPPWRETGEGHGLYCHIPLDELRESQVPAFRFAGRGDAPVAGDGGDGAGNAGGRRGETDG